MPKAIDLIGIKFGRLIVIKKAGKDKCRHTKWLCKCECGEVKVIYGSNLRRGMTKSCGCLNNEVKGKRLKSINTKRRLVYGLASMRRILGVYKRVAKRKGHSFDLTEEQFKELTQQDCHYCGTKPENISGQNRCNGIYIYNGIDRIDNNKGYILENSVPCCKRCNTAKNDSTIQEYKDWIIRSYQKII